MLKLHSLAIFNAFLFMVIALPVLFTPDSAKKRVLKLTAKLPNIQILGFFRFLLAYLILATYAGFDKSWITAMSVLGYLHLIGGIIQLWWPKFVKERIKAVAKSQNGPTIIGLITLALGLFFGYLGYYIY